MNMMMGTDGLNPHNAVIVTAVLQLLIICKSIVSLVCIDKVRDKYEYNENNGINLNFLLYVYLIKITIWWILDSLVLLCRICGPYPGQNNCKVLLNFTKVEMSLWIKIRVTRIEKAWFMQHLCVMSRV